MTVNADLNQARLKDLFSYDAETGLFKRFRRLGPKKDIAGHIATKGHRQIMVDKKLYMAHRLAWLYIYGYFPDTLIDHICDLLRISTIFIGFLQSREAFRP